MAVKPKIRYKYKKKKKPWSEKRLEVERQKKLEHRHKLWNRVARKLGFRTKFDMEKALGWRYGYICRAQGRKSFPQHAMADIIKFVDGDEEFTLWLVYEIVKTYGNPPSKRSKCIWLDEQEDD